jgi:hypothetical protein
MASTDGSRTATSRETLQESGAVVRRRGIVRHVKWTFRLLLVEPSYPLHKPHDHQDDYDRAEYSVAEHCCLLLITLNCWTDIDQAKLLDSVLSWQVSLTIVRFVTVI